MSKEQRKPRYVPKKTETQGVSQKPTKEPEPQVIKEQAPQPRVRKPQPPKKKMYIEKKSSQPEQHCLVCSESIQVREAIWTCKCCFQLMHLACIRKWIFSLNKDNKKKERYGWSCPQCKFEYIQALPQYFCFCGKYKNPEYESGIPAHSCGSYCERKRGFYCPHPCPDICHSGRCRPCTYQGIEITCGCGKSKMNIRCSDEKQSFVCGKKCQKLLNCSKHKCSQNCHQGFCNPCSYKHMAACYCGKNETVIDCVETSYQCDDICGKPLDCGNHTCQDRCHKGACRGCTRMPETVKTCPCGQYNLTILIDTPRKVCTDSIPVCGMPCKRTLVCGHLCPNSCHEGSCKPCKVEVAQRCKCESINRKAQCWQLYDTTVQFRCEKICKHRKSCGQHNCSKECCEFRTSNNVYDHHCLLICQKQLNCGKHTCGLQCHSGNCGRCPVLYSQPQPCPCGRTFLRAPVVCGTIVPQCSNMCDKTMDCGHICTLTCHYGNCKCFEKVLVECECGKNKIETTCGRQVLCTEKCEKMLPCGHICGTQCHKGDCPFDGSSNGCSKVCNKKRVVCEHVCLEKCHPKNTCDVIPCRTEVSVKCECGNRVSMAQCGSTNVKLEKHIQCNKVCENMKRFSDLFKERKIYYPTGLVYFGMKNWKYVQKVEESLVQFIKSGAPSLHIYFTKFLVIVNAKYNMHTLFEKHYHLNVTFYSNKKTTFFTLSPTKTTMVPQPSLYKYIRMIETGQIKKQSIPFTASIRVPQLTKDRTDIMEGILSEFAHHFYSERKDKNQYFHFWLEDHAQSAMSLLREKYPSYTFTIEVSPKTDEQMENIAPEEIFQQEVEKINDQEEKKQNQQVQKAIAEPPISTPEAVQKINESAKQGEQKPTLETEKIPEKIVQRAPKLQQQSKKPEAQVKVAKKPEFMLGKKKYPPSEEYVQFIYQIDDDELYNEPKDWDDYVQRISQKDLGVVASQWRIRSLIIVRALFDLKVDPTKEFIQKLMGLYKEEQARARRTLSIRNIELKKTKQVLESEGVYLSGNQPEIVSYNLLLNPDLNPNSFLSDELIQTAEVQSAHQILHSLESNNHQVYFHTLKSCDFMTACTLLPYLNKMRLAAVGELVSKGKGKIYNLTSFWNDLFFDSQTLFTSFLSINNLKYIQRESKKTPGKIVFVVSRVKAGEQSLPAGDKEVIRESELLLAKRDAQFAFGEEPGELLREKYCLRSYFAFGDYKTEDYQYETKLIKSLRRK